MGPTMMRSGPGSGSTGMGRGMGGMGMGRMPMGINGQPFAMDRIDFRPKLGSSEIWEVLPNMMAHPFHVHGVIFHVLAIGGKEPPAHLAGPKDTVLLDQPGEIVMTFTQPASTRYPFMFHCHILEHEDAGMMGLYATS
jgi:FtsP/CotA-like multicopper oxidase with cupredoxin domain